MEDLHWLITLIRTYGYWVIGIGIFIECMGIPFPGEMVLILSGVAASHGHLNLTALIIIAAVTAVFGDNAGYYVGKKFGRKIIAKLQWVPFFKPHHVEKAENFFKRHGNKTVFIGRYTAFLRTYAAVLAGVFHMPYRSFFIYNLTGGVSWAIIMACLGYAIGNNLHLLAKIMTNVNLLTLSAIGLFILWKVGKMVLVNRRNSRPKKDEIL